MATYAEIRQLFSDSTLSEKMEVAVIIAANNLLAGSETAAQKAWAVSVFSNPHNEAKKAMMAVLATHNALTVNQIQTATDAVVQAAVNNVVPTLVDAMAGV